MKRVFVFFCFVLLLQSCFFPDRSYRFKFINNADFPIYVLTDLNAEDERLSPGSSPQYVDANYYGYISNHHPWDKVITDSIHLYVIDASNIKLPPRPLSNENIETIEDLILERITVYNSDVARPEEFEVVFP